MLVIMKTYLYNFNPLIPLFQYLLIYTDLCDENSKLQIAKLAYKLQRSYKTPSHVDTYLPLFHSSAQNIDCGYSLEPPRRGGSNEYPQSIFYAEIRKNIRIFI